MADSTDNSTKFCTTPTWTTTLCAGVASSDAVEPRSGQMGGRNSWK